MEPADQVVVEDVDDVSEHDEGHTKVNSLDNATHNNFSFQQR